MKYKRKAKLDAYSNHIINRIPTEIQRTFTSEQKEAIQKAIRSGIEPKEHAIDLRGVIPLFYKKYYFVFHFGRDTRSVTQENEEERRKIAKHFANTLFIIFALSPLLLLLFLALYFIKSALGINIFPNLHLSDIFDMIWNRMDNWFNSFGN